MLRLIYLLVASLWMASAPATDFIASAGTVNAPLARIGETDSRQMEKDLQQLPWKQFRSVIVAIPKMKAAIDAYGPGGWQFVRENYANYGWKKHIDKLDASQKRQLADLIKAARGAR